MVQSDLFLVFIASALVAVQSAACWAGWEASLVKPPEWFRVLCIVALVLAMFVASITGFNLFLGMYN